MLVFKERGKPEYPEKNLSEQGKAKAKLNPHMASTPGFEPGPHWWETSALTTAPYSRNIIFFFSEIINMERNTKFQKYSN